ncbi:MAG: hypothetical protein HY322_16000 [Betaproteobacteria bacterium]|nr:hypothetical protein [Betaproteobacteria bacterium]
MWKVNVFGSDGWQTAHTEGVYKSPTIDVLLEASKKAFPNAVAPLHLHLESEREYSSPGAFGILGRQPISFWAKLAEDQSREFDWATGSEVVALDEEALALYRPDRKKGTPTVIAWHEPTAIVIRLPSTPTELQVEYIPDTDADDRLARLRYRYATPNHALETVFDWRGYFGPNTAIIDGWHEMAGDRRGFIARLRGTTGFIIGRTLRRLTFDNPTLDRDPLFECRERGAARRYPDVASACPVLSERNPVSAPHAMVFVHGATSCGLQGLKDLFVAGAMPSYPVRRFEHDTFLPLERNADELALLISRSVRVQQLLLVAHSRGGLVARLAMESLARDRFPANIALHTLGTPHLGTPLVAIGRRLLSQLYKIGEWGLGLACPALSPLTWAHGFLFDAPVLPPGIEAMGANSSALNILNRLGDPVGVTCWGSRFDPNSPTSGFGIEVEGLLRGAMYGVPNDLVIPTSSTVGFGSPEGLLTCSHVQYFTQVLVKAELRRYFNPVPVATPSPEPVAHKEPTIEHAPRSSSDLPLDENEAVHRRIVVDKLKRTAKNYNLTVKKKEDEKKE